MQELKVIGVESGALLVADDDGAQFRLAVDDMLHARIRQATPPSGVERKLAPKEIQAQIRAGMSAEDVAAVTGASLEDIRRFEGPVLAEREFVIQSALSVRVRPAGETDPLASSPNFGDVIRGRLVDAGAVGERWASWKEQGGGWVVKLTFSADGVDHDARWGFDPKRHTLTPLGGEAESLSRDGDLPAPLIPRLRAVPLDEGQEAGEQDPASARFDSGAFTVDDEAAESPARGSREAASPERPRSDRADRPTHQTADLLEALRRRRGERDPMDPEPDDHLAGHPAGGAIRLVDVPLDTPPEESTPAPAGGTPPAPASASSPAPLGKSHRKRASMPSWDDIVFGARPDED